MQIDQQFLEDVSAERARISSLRRVGIFFIKDFINNAYDANASQINIIFQDFGNNYQAQANSKIILEDDGDGIDLEMLENWFSYGKSTKSSYNNIHKDTIAQELRYGKSTKSSYNNISIMSQNRILIGGIGKGRQHTLALGNKVKILTKTRQSKDIRILEYVFANDNIEASLVSDIAPSGQKHGTRIEISDLNKSWNERKILNFFDKLTKQSYLLSNEESFRVSFYKDKHCIKSFLYRSKNKYWVRLIIIMKYIRYTIFKGIYAIKTSNF